MELRMSRGGGGGSSKRKNRFRWQRGSSQQSISIWRRGQAVARAGSRCV